METNCCNTNFVFVTGTIKPNFPCMIVNIYCPNELSKRKKLWETIISIGNECIGGNFNEIRNIGEKKGMAGSTGMRDFKKDTHIE